MATRKDFNFKTEIRKGQTKDVRHQGKGRKQAAKGQLEEGKDPISGGPQTILTVVQGRQEAQVLVQSLTLNFSFPPAGSTEVGLVMAKGPIRLVDLWHFQLLLTLGHCHAVGRMWPWTCLT